MEKIDLFKQFKGEYVQAKSPVLVDVSPARYLSVDGAGEPGGAQFEVAIGALYGMAFTVKMTRKAAGLGDYVVCKLEGLWWADGDEQNLSKVPKEQWRWRLMIRTPDCVGQDDLEQARHVLAGRGKGSGVDGVVLEGMDQGRCVQMLHVGPYDQVGEAVGQMQEFMAENGLEPGGRHHEIYLSDPRRVPAERLKTIVRAPVK